METYENQSMADGEYRAILTEREKEILTGEADVTKKYYFRVVTRVRRKIESLEEDLAILDEAHDSLGDELRNVVCNENDVQRGE